MCLLMQTYVCMYMCIRACVCVLLLWGGRTCEHAGVSAHILSRPSCPPRATACKRASACLRSESLISHPCHYPSGFYRHYLRLLCNDICPVKMCPVSQGWGMGGVVFGPHQRPGPPRACVQRGLRSGDTSIAQ